MTASELPDDPGEWPDDPFELLGCEPDADRLALKRAYTRRIRKFKPENHPNEFRRLRDAYEWAERLVARREEYQQRQAEQDDVHETDSLADADLPPSTRDDAPATSPTGEETWDGPPEPKEARPPRERAIDAIWAEACSGGDLAAPYRRLTELLAERPGDEELCVRLYWLLRLAPEVDTTRPALAWLVEGLGRSGLRGRLLELYLAHLEEEPAEGVSERTERVLKFQGPIAGLFALLTRRWRAAARMGRDDVLSADLAVFRSRFLDEDSELWVRLLLVALGYLVWIPRTGKNDPVDALQREIHEATETQLKLADELDRCDLLMELAAKCQELQVQRAPWPRRSGGPRPTFQGDQLARSLAAMLPVLWNAPPGHVQTWLWEWVAALVRKPQVGLEQLDLLLDRSSAFLAFTGELLGQLGGTPVEREEPNYDALQRRVLSFFDLVDTRSYAKIRPRLAAFCVGELLPMERILEVIHEHPTYYGFSDSMRSDLSLQTLLAAARTFWG